MSKLQQYTKLLLRLKQCYQQTKINNKLKSFTDQIGSCRNQVKTYFQYNCQQYEFLPSYLELMERPPSPTARLTAITISILVLLLLVWAYIGQLDIHATATGRLILPNRSQTIQSYELSEVVQILVTNGQHVKAGDKLLVLNIVGITQEINRCQEQESFYQLE